MDVEPHTRKHVRRKFHQDESVSPFQGAPRHNQVTMPNQTKSSRLPCVALEYRRQTQCCSIGENRFSLSQRLSIANSLLAVCGICVLFPFSVLRLHLADLCLLVPADSLSSYVYQSCCARKTLLPWCLPSPLALTVVFPHPLRTDP